MNSNYLPLIILAGFVTNTGEGFAQTSRITSGAVYILKSKASNKLLDVSNSSLENGARVDCWIDTRSNVQKWRVINVGKDVYTITNMATEKLLHITSSLSDWVMVDQYENNNNNDMKWIISREGKGTYSLRSLTNPDFSLHASDTVDGSAVTLRRFSNLKMGKWIFLKETVQEDAPTPEIADKIFDAWFKQYGIEKSKGFWDNAEMMEIVLDAYEVTKDPKYISRFKAMYDNFLINNKSDWQYNKYNDDITWAVLFCMRGYLLTGNKTYQEKAMSNLIKCMPVPLQINTGEG